MCFEDWRAVLMNGELLDIKNLTVSVEEKKVLHDVNLNIKKGEIHVLMGPNGAGKSTLGFSLMGNPRYRIDNGKIIFKGKDITHEAPDKRSQQGMFLSFQNPLEINGISLAGFIRSAVKQHEDNILSMWKFKKELEDNMEILNMDKSYAERDLNVGFSGGEKKKAEILQLLMMKPSLAILDETDSGLDVDASRIVSKGIEKYQKEQNGALLIITHNTKILESLKVDYTHVIVNGRIIKNGDSSLIDEINLNGFEQFVGDIDD